MNNTFLKAVQSLVTPDTGLQVVDLDIIPDPNIQGTYALRAHLEDGEFRFFLVSNLAKVDVETILNSMEEVEFKTWPPTSSGKFSW